jgi:hypothetical protein
LSFPIDDAVVRRQDVRDTVPSVALENVLSEVLMWVSVLNELFVDRIELFNVGINV